MITLKEKKMLLKMKTAMGESTDELRAEIEDEEQRLAEQQQIAEEAEQIIREERKNAFQSIFADLSKDIGKLIADDKKKTAEQQAVINQFANMMTSISTGQIRPKSVDLVEEKIPEVVETEEKIEAVSENIPVISETKEKSLVEATVDMVKSTTPPSMFVQPEPSLVDKDIRAIQQKMKFLEGWVSKISMAGPGGGAASVDQLDHKTTAVVADSYNVGRHDYYIGVDYPGNVAIYLPTTVNNGRVLVIKDESGSAGFYPIIVVGRVDNDPDGFILKVNNGAVQLIYRNGWRII